jgi:hypothetical protein
MKRVAVSLTQWLNCQNMMKLMVPSKMIVAANEIVQLSVKVIACICYELKFLFQFFM